MVVSASQVKKLRKVTGAGVMDCKAALSVTNGQMNEAIDWLRKKGIAEAGKKTNRTAAEGLVCILSKETTAVIVEINSETDFVSRNDIFQSLVRNIALSALETDGSLDQLIAVPYPDSDLSVAETIRDAISNIGENLSLRRVSMLRINAGVIATYIHNSIAEGLGKIGVMVALETKGNKENALKFGRQVAMHIAASNPTVLSIADLPSEVIEREKSIFFEQARQSGRPENIVKKMVEGRMQKFYKEVVLLSQAFIMNPDLSVIEAIKEAESERNVGAPIKITGYVRFVLGDGIEKEQKDSIDTRFLFV